MAQEESYLFEADSSRACELDEYNIGVTAKNQAGSSDPSEVTVSLIPLPDVSPVMELLQVSLEDTPTGITLNVSFKVRKRSIPVLLLASYTRNLSSKQNVTPCPDHPVAEYALVLADSLGNITAHRPGMTGDWISIVVEGLMEDTKYFLYVQAMNDFGKNSVFDLAPMEIGKDRPITTVPDPRRGAGGINAPLLPPNYYEHNLITFPIIMTPASSLQCRAQFYCDLQHALLSKLQDPALSYGLQVILSTVAHLGVYHHTHIVYYSMW